MHLKQKKTSFKKLARAKTNIELQNPGLVTFYETRTGSGVGLFL